MKLNLTFNVDHNQSIEFLNSWLQPKGGIQKLTGVSGFNLTTPNFFHAVDRLNLVGYLNNLWVGISILHC